MKFTNLTISSLLASTVWARTPVKFFYTKNNSLHEIKSFISDESDGGVTYRLGGEALSRFPVYFYWEDGYLVTEDGDYLGDNAHYLGYGKNVRPFRIPLDYNQQLVGIYYVCPRLRNRTQFHIGSLGWNRGECQKTEIFIRPVLNEAEKLADQKEREKQKMRSKLLSNLV